MAKVEDQTWEGSSTGPSIRCLLDPSTPEKRRHDGVIKQKGSGRPLVKAPSFAFKAPAVYHMNKIITCLLHLDHFKRPSSPPARTRACVRVGAILSRGYEYAGLSPRCIIIPWLRLRATTAQSPSARPRNRELKQDRESSQSNICRREKQLLMIITSTASDFFYLDTKIRWKRGKKIIKFI